MLRSLGAEVGFIENLAVVSAVTLLSYLDLLQRGGGFGKGRW